LWFQNHDFSRFAKSVFKLKQNILYSRIANKAREKMRIPVFLKIDIKKEAYRLLRNLTGQERTGTIFQGNSSIFQVPFNIY